MLSKEQQSIIEDSIWVVNTALKNQGLELSPKTEDLRQSAILYMCKCLERFDPTRNIKWSTYAYKNVYLYIKRQNKREIRCRQHEIEDEDIYKTLEEYEAETDNQARLIIDKISQKCTPRERELLDLKLKGYKGREIGVIMGISISRISLYMKSIKEKAKDIRGAIYER